MVIVFEVDIGFVLEVWIVWLIFILVFVFCSFIFDCFIIGVFVDFVVGGGVIEFVGVFWETDWIVFVEILGFEFIVVWVIEVFIFDELFIDIVLKVVIGE